MATLEAIILWTHIAAGVVALVMGGGALVTTKGGVRHRQAGRIYVWSMSVIVGTVLLLLIFAQTTDRIFLTLIAIFSGYFAFSGYRILSRKRPLDTALPLDWVAAGLVIGACVFLGGWGISILLGGDSFGSVMIVFGFIGIFIGSSDLIAFHKSNIRGSWLINHLARMVSAYLATVTAVSVTSFTLAPPIVRWLWPTVIGVPLTWYLIRKYSNTEQVVQQEPMA